MPALGHGITVMLDGAVDGNSPQIQLEALGALQEIYSASRDQAALAGFLPGTISSMAKLLASPNRHKAAVLVKSLSVVQAVLTRVLGDMRLRPFLAKYGRSAKDGRDEEDESSILGPSWLKATSSQVRLALSAMMKLRSHSSQAVHDALENLCVSLLDECHSSLESSLTILVETAIILDSSETESDVLSAKTSLRHLVGIYPELADAVKTAVYSWMSSLPRIMHAADVDAKQVAVHNLTKGIALLQSLGIESSTLEDSLADSLRDSIVSVLQSSKPSGTSTHLRLTDGSYRKDDSSEDFTFQPVILGSESQRVLRREMLALINAVASTSLKKGIAASMMDHARESGTSDQVASLWLCYELVKSANASSDNSDELLNLAAFDESTNTELEPIFEDLYSYAVLALESHAESGPLDWRNEATALEITAYAAHRLGEAFRPDLMDVLFPIATFLGSENSLLQQHAVACLNSMASSCGYNGVSDLIIDNVDYMVNSVSLRLNSLDISPASMQVLTMMIRLSGPRLVPYLNDVVDSIFAALENYHGYTAFTETLFSVLTEIVWQASRTDKRLLTNTERTEVNHKKKPGRMHDINDFLEYLDKRNARIQRERDEEEDNLDHVKGHPEVPWKSVKDQDGEDEEPQGEPPSEEKPPNSPTYKLLLRIASLTQHYLTSPTPKLRRELLGLLTTASPILSSDEDIFLPLVNAIWPVVIQRLRDPEAFVATEACLALSGLCAAAGDFLNTRFKTEWGDWLAEWCRKVKRQAVSSSSQRQAGPVSSSVPAAGKDIMIPVHSGADLEVKGVVVKSAESSSLGQHASPMKLWEATVKLLTAMVSYVTVDEAMFDDILDLLADALEKDASVKDALDVINADAVWQARYERGRIEWQPAPVMDGVKFIEMEKLA